VETKLTGTVFLFYSSDILVPIIGWRPGQLPNSFISFSFFPNLEHRAPFVVSVITHILRHTVGLLWTSDQPVA
jgi:hypothetical protein